MRPKKKSKLILIMIIMLSILIILAGIAYAYFGTDLFKSNKQLFFKYITQIGDEKEGFIEETLKQYWEKQKNTAYANNGNITINITANQGQEQFENTNQTNITFDGQIDNANTQAIQNISLNYSESVKFPIKYQKNGDIIGIQTDYIGSKYIAMEKDEAVKKVKSIEKIQELANVSLNKEEMQHISSTYLNICKEQLQDNQFSKIEENNAKGYQVTITGESLKNIIVKLLETLKSDEATLNKINEYIKIQKNSSKITVNDLDNLIENINANSDINNETLQITIYESKGKTSRIYITTKDIELQVEKNISANDLQYQIELQVNGVKAQFIAKWTGMQSMQNVTENYEISIEEQEIRYQYNVNNNVEFTNSTNIEGLNDNNTLMLNKMSEEDKNNFLQAVTQRLESVNKDQMEKLGLTENENPLDYIIPESVSSLGVYTGAQISEEEVGAFNKKFELYESTNLQGVTVKGLFSTIQLNNESQENENRKIKEVHFDGEEYDVTDQNITILKSNVETETAYRVAFEKDEQTGIIYRVVINKK